MESDNKEMSSEVKSLQQARTECEQRRKKVEAQLQELQSKAAEAERTKGELSERSHRLQVLLRSITSTSTPPAVALTLLTDRWSWTTCPCCWRSLRRRA